MDWLPRRDASEREKDWLFVIEGVELKHNHQMINSPTMLAHLYSHKTDDAMLDKLVKNMSSDNLTHLQIMSTLSWMSGGP